ncbi:glycoside hydrolase family 47 protein [Hygrophoropsis aurantiaca]|uniref:Glycoside hydrolase family 47 protein n=1 Tax=Hygrophoropsis aurantiaca TaxID=72124 RepID=A0ACB8ARA3_9AGAM|nr:glycoside hydrolase family 47 protein [Hygrophoropsis aurantiaca]
MAEPILRQRKKDAAEVPEQTEKPAHANHAAKSSSTGNLYVCVLLALGLLVYQFPNLAKVPLAFLGQSNENKHLPGVRPSSVRTFSADIPKRDAVVEAFKHAWLAYERDAMGDDEYHPFSHMGTNLTSAGGIGYTVADSIDTMLIMGLDEEYQRARTWIAEKLSFDRDANFNTFETTIRVMGGLLAAYHLSDQDPLFLEKAQELGDRILPTFETPSGLPLSLVNLGLKEGVPDMDNNGMMRTYIGKRLKGNVMAVLRAARMPHGLASIFLSPEEGRYMTASIRLGSRGDSYYEYLIKQYLQTNQTEDMYDDAMAGIHNYLVQTSISSKLTYTAELNPERTGHGELLVSIPLTLFEFDFNFDSSGWRLTPKQDHLVCFLGGSLMLGATTSGALVHPVSIPPRPEELSEAGRRDWKTGVELVKTCMATHETATGLSPEIVHFRMPGDDLDAHVAATGEMPTDWYIKGSKPGSPPSLDARYILRPETVESLFLAFRLTGDTQYRDQGWAIFQAIEKHCRVASGGYASVLNVDQIPVEHEDKMETFLMSETLKYLYLLFTDTSVLPLDDYVFNTEAHPFPVFNPSFRTGFS